MVSHMTLSRRTDVSAFADNHIDNDDDTDETMLLSSLTGLQ